MDLQLLGILLTLALSAFFAGAETVFLTVNRARLQAWAKSGRRGARYAWFMAQKPERFVTTSLTGNNLVNVIYSSLFALWLSGMGVSERNIFITAPLILLVIGETIPKAVARQTAERMVIGAGMGLFAVRILLLPAQRLIEMGIAAGWRKIGPRGSMMDRSLSRTELRDLFKGFPGVGQGMSEDMIHRLLRLSTLRIEEIMTPRTQVVAIPADSDVDEARRLIASSGYTRLPVYDGNLDNVVGFVAAMDLLGQPKSIRSVLRRLPMAPESMKIIKFLPWFRRERVSLAGVLDEYGGFAGIVGVDDVAQELVGPIYDEYDEVSKDALKLPGNIYLLKGSARLSHVARIAGIELSSASAHSIGGLANELAGDIAKVGAEFDLPGARLRVLRAGPRGAELVRLTVSSLPAK